ncbi:SH3 domain-containing protein [Marimonas arenosa]|uniref:SH3 domain-containing protein n=1 Tax=Marimonas arenosa TaxID=1795305 RepID=A0AAE4B3X0_9RHOB|nr:SH3 domain-containing protein [Marimonas arenosa]MDQ2089630.1 SH3 domain-containing protein [Marimonas arenosa]
MKHTVRLVASLCLLFPATLASAQDIRTETVNFAAGASGTTIRDRITGYESVSYKLGAEAGQRLSITLNPSNTQTYFNVYGPGSGPGDQAIANSSMTLVLNRFDGILPGSGDYTVSVYMMRVAARRNEVSDYALDISITGATGATVQSDYADGLQGGPDYWRVNTSGGGLNMRTGPSSEAGAVTKIGNGTNLRNLGCRMAEGRRWCRVATLADPGYEGWVAGDFLIEGSDRASAAPVQPTHHGAGQSGASSDVRVRFAAGTTGSEMTGALAPGESRRYLIGAAANQALYVRVAPQGPGLSYQIFNPDRSFLLGAMDPAQEYRGQLWQSGDHAIEVFNRGGTTVSYNIIIGID